MKSEYNSFKNLNYKQSKQKLNKLFGMYDVLKNDYMVKQVRINNIFSKLTICENKLIIYRNNLINSGFIDNVAKIRIYAKNPEGKEIGTIYGIGAGNYPRYEIYTPTGSLVLSGYCPTSLEEMNQYLAIASGSYIIKVIFNGIGMNQEVILTPGQTKNIIFSFARKEIGMYNFIAACYSIILEPYYRFNMVNPYDGESIRYYIQHMGNDSSKILLTAKPNGSYEGAGAINARLGDRLPMLSVFDNNGYIEIQIDPPDDWGHFPTMEEYMLGESSKFHCSTIPYDEEGTAL